MIFIFLKAEFYVVIKLVFFCSWEDFLINFPTIDVGIKLLRLYYFYHTVWEDNKVNHFRKNYICINISYFWHRDCCLVGYSFILLGPGFDCSANWNLVLWIFWASSIRRFLLVNSKPFSLINFLLICWSSCFACDAVHCFLYGRIKSAFADFVDFVVLDVDFVGSIRV